MLRLLAVFILGVGTTYMLPSELFNEMNTVLNLFIRGVIGLLFVLLIWLMQPNSRKRKKEADSLNEKE